jgi:HAD superfamily hydrolase (TIGR01459 family)
MARPAANDASAQHPRVPLMRGMGELAPRYDAFLVDSYGVLHDGSSPYRGAVECLRRLRAAGKRVAVLTNTPRRSATVSSEIARVGVVHDCYDVLVSAGEVTHAMLARAGATLGLAPGQRFFYVGPERSREIVSGLPFDETTRMDDADFMVITGLVPGLDTEPDYDALLRRALRRAVVAVCANPDRVAIRAGRLGLCAGAIAARYEALGGRVRFLGKPYPEIYVAAMQQLRGVDPARVAAVGDALATDIAGARGEGFDSIFVAGGIHADEVCGRSSTVDADTRAPGAPDARALEALFERTGIRPTLAVPRFVWEPT